MGINERFHLISSKVASVAGSAGAFIGGAALIAAWLSCGYYFKWSDGYQLIINTVTSIITFLMVFIIQNTQNRTDRAILLKLDEIIRSHEHSRDEFISVELLDEKIVKQLQEEMKKVRAGEIIIKGIRKHGNTTKDTLNSFARNS